MTRAAFRGKGLVIALLASVLIWGTVDWEGCDAADRPVAVSVRTTVR